MDLKETDILGESIGDHWYYRSKAAALMKLLGHVGQGAILDVGAGSGFFSRYLLRNTAATEGWCVDISYRGDSDEHEGSKPIHLRRDIERSDASLVLLMDVLEHVDDDVALLASYVGKVPSGSRFLVSVPAFQFLWSEHDDFLEHRRRYDIAMVEATMKGAGVRVDRAAYYFGAVFPIAVAVRLLGRSVRPPGQAPRSQLKKHSALVNGVLSFLSRIELPFFPVNRLAGLSVFCIGTKP